MSHESDFRPAMKAVDAAERERLVGAELAKFPWGEILQAHLAQGGWIEEPQLEGFDVVDDPASGSWTVQVSLTFSESARQSCDARLTSHPFAATVTLEVSRISGAARVAGCEVQNVGWGDDHYFEG